MLAIGVIACLLRFTPALEEVHLYLDNPGGEGTCSEQ